MTSPRLSPTERLLCLILVLLVLCACVGCGAPAQVNFEVKGTTPTKDGTFTNKHDWNIVPTEVKIVLGDIHLKREDLSQNIEVFSSLPPLVPAGTIVPADDIGKLGRFPGMWAANIIHNNTAPLRFPTGNVEVASWQQVQLRMSPAVSGVRGITAGDALLQNTVLVAATIRRKQATCVIRIRAAISLGIATRAQFSTKATLIHRNTIEINYAKWFDDIQFGTLCDANTNNDAIEINNNSQPQIIDQIKTALPASMTFQFSAGTAQ